MYQVIKRDGKVADFDLSKIAHAIKLAFDAQEKQYNQDIIDFLALKVTSNFQSKIQNGLVAVEDV
ncbi:MAG: hypothetical protein IKZ21_06285, partial [Clostridia bacterium]|nr:hypothetical protein [Clostridia bacterium]